MKDKKFDQLYKLLNSSVNILKNIILALAMTVKSHPKNHSNSPEDTFDTDLDVLQPYKT